MTEVVNNKSECFSLIMMNFTEVRWKNLIMNYDNMLNGYVALLLLVSPNTQHTHRKSFSVNSTTIIASNRTDSSHFSLTLNDLTLFK